MGVPPQGTRLQNDCRVPTVNIPHCGIGVKKNLDATRQLMDPIPSLPGPLPRLRGEEGATTHPCPAPSPAKRGRAGEGALVCSENARTSLIPKRGCSDPL